jgi:hypothetical protein
VVGAKRCELAEASAEGILMAWRGRVVMREILMAWRGRVVMREKFHEMVGDG